MPQQSRPERGRCQRYTRPHESSMHWIRTVVLVVALAVTHLAAQTPTAPQQWAQWRGPEFTGVSSTANPPLEWSETKNVRWKVEIPGRGNASPVVWGDRIFLMTAVPVGLTGDAAHQPRGGIQPRIPHRFVVMAIARKDGKVVWQRTVREEAPHEGSHTENGTYA